MSPLTVTIPGVPVPQGSKRNVGHGVMVESNPALRPWRADAIAAIQAAMADTGHRTITGQVRLDADLLFPRPKSHYRTGRNAQLLRESAPARKATKPDLDKLLRALCDALTQAGAWHDDAQVVTITATKGWVEDLFAHPRTVCTITALEVQE